MTNFIDKNLEISYGDSDKEVSDEEVSDRQ